MNVCIILYPFSFVLIVLPKSRGIMYSLKNIEQIDKSNIFIEPSISDGDLMIRNARPSDEGDYLCDVKCSDPNFKETQIIKLHVEKGKNKWKWHVPLRQFILLPKIVFIYTSEKELYLYFRGGMRLHL